MQDELLITTQPTTSAPRETGFSSKQKITHITTYNRQLVEYKCLAYNANKYLICAKLAYIINKKMLTPKLASQGQERIVRSNDKNRTILFIQSSLQRSYDTQTKCTVRLTVFFSYIELKLAWQRNRVKTTRHGNVNNELRNFTQIKN
jgi:hypothetical protein